ncbi:MAG TPA: PadR family transcriptional regulator [Nocardioides sp.]|jgi:DNA-binding PadR family transcriptional regulator
MGQELPVTSYALLGLLTFGDELTGYELKQRADITLRFYWVSPAMSQVYTELRRLTDAGLVEPIGDSRGQRYRITERGRKELKDWMDGTPAGFPVLKHPVLLRLLMGHVTDPATIKAMLREYVDELTTALVDLDEVRESLRGADAPGEAFRHPSLVADWGLAYFASEARLARETLARLDEGPLDKDL